MLEALRAYQQADEDGVMVLVSRQACDEAATEIERLRTAIAAIQQATLDGKVCDDVAWFSGIETLHDYCDRVLNCTTDQAQLI